MPMLLLLLLTLVRVKNINNIIENNSENIEKYKAIIETFFTTNSTFLIVSEYNVLRTYFSYILENCLKIDSNSCKSFS